MASLVLNDCELMASLGLNNCELMAALVLNVKADESLLFAHNVTMHFLHLW